MPFIKSPFTRYKKLLLPRCKHDTIRSESFHYFGEKLMMLSKRDFYSCLQCGKAWVASGPDQWPTVVNFVQLQTKKQPVISTIVKGQNFNTEHGNNSGDCFSFCRIFKSELKRRYRLAGLQHYYTDLKPAQRPETISVSIFTCRGQETLRKSLSPPQARACCPPLRGLRSPCILANRQNEAPLTLAPPDNTWYQENTH